MVIENGGPDIGDNLHEIQQHILQKLGYREEKKFSELQGNWSSNKVSFHLNRLQEEGLIAKENKKYRTTTKAKGILADIKFQDYQAPINILSLTVFSPDGEVYMEYHESTMDPLSECYRTITQRIIRGERIEKKARDLYKDRFGTKPKSKIKKAGVLDTVLRFSEDYSQHYLVYILYTEIEKSGENFYSLNELKDLEVIPGEEKMIRRIAEKRDLPFIGERDLADTGGIELERLEFK